MTKTTAPAYAAWQDPEERERILMEQLPQVRYIARRIHERLPRHVALEDLVHAGVLGLIDALHKYDGAKHVQFGCYANDLPPFFAHEIIRHFPTPGLRLRTAEPAKRSRTQPAPAM